MHFASTSFSFMSVGCSTNESLQEVCVDGLGWSIHKSIFFLPFYYLLINDDTDWPDGRNAKMLRILSTSFSSLCIYFLRPSREPLKSRQQFRFHFFLSKIGCSPSTGFPLRRYYGNLQQITRSSYRIGRHMKASWYTFVELCEQSV